MTPEAAARLKTLISRAAGRRALLKVPRFDGKKTRRVTTVPRGDCHNEEVCGTVHSIPGTKLALVTVGQSCPGYDGCQLRAQLYDPARRRFLGLINPGTSAATPLDDEVGIGMETLWVAPDGRAFVHDGTLLVPGVSRFAEPLDEDTFFGSRGGGWLGGQWAADVLTF